MSSNTSSPDDRAALGRFHRSQHSECRHDGRHTNGFIRQIARGAALAQRQLDLNAESIDLSMFSRCRCVIHTAGRAHVIYETEPSPLAAFRRINLSGTVMIAKTAANAGLSRFIFLSSIGVLGTATTNRPFHPSLPASPVEDYARSKAEAETALSELSRLCDIEMIIVRRPLVYGPNPKGNFARLLDRVHRKQAMPVGLRSNRRFFVGVDRQVGPRAGNNAFRVLSLSPESGFIAIKAEALTHRPWPGKNPHNLCMA
jgi:nucleoside-diphosphate-sugar epimerase